MRLFAILLLLAVTPQTYANAQSVVEQAARDELAFMSSEEPAMRRAFKKAQDSLDEFLRSAASPAPGTSNHALKVAVSDGKNTEYFWVTPFRAKGDQFEGILANEPRMVKKYRNGEKFSFSRAAVVDWTYTETSGRRMVGNFTACALLTKEPPDQAKKFKSQYGLQCD